MADSANWMVFLVLAVFLRPLVAANASSGALEKPPAFLQLYAHESFVAPTETLIVSAAPSGDVSGPDEFGLLRTVSNVLRADTTRDSLVIGSQVGLVVIGKDLVPVYISYTYFLNENATYHGTIAIHGHIDGSSTVDREFAVVGGTGDFLSVTGVDRSVFEPGSNVPDPSFNVNTHNLTLYYIQK